ncbi:MAG: type II toxin-antitoxin system RelE/ParE family toxin [Alphaproteobacteria bacterium]|nr:type II toxin-antitoxin system RelE/ParE family toxin [Alphaproteobacteria bacterium]
MTYAIEYFERVVNRDIPSLPKTMRTRIKNAIETRLAVDPVGFGKPLQNTLKGYRRLRIGDYRVVFRIEASRRCVVIVAIAHRKSIYGMLNGILGN